MKDYSKIESWLLTWGEELRGGTKVSSEESILGRLMRIHGHSEPSEIAMCVDGMVSLLMYSRPIEHKILKNEYLSSLEYSGDRIKQMKMSRNQYSVILRSAKSSIATLLISYGFELDPIENKWEKNYA